MGFYRGPSFVKENLILSLDAASSRSYPGSGTTWYNLVNKTLSCSLVNGVSFSSENNGTIVMDGTNDIIYAPSVNQLGGLTNHSFEIWVKSPGLGSGKSVGGLISPDYGIISDITGSGEVRYYVYSTDSGYPGSYILYLGTSGANMFSNQWKHVVCTRQNNGTGRIYINGQLNTESGNTGSWSGKTIWSDMNTQIGNNPNDVYYNLYGSIAIARIYNKSLTETEVLNNFKSTKSRFGL